MSRRDPINTLAILGSVAANCTPKIENIFLFFQIFLIILHFFILLQLNPNSFNMTNVLVLDDYHDRFKFNMKDIKIVSIESVGN